MQRFRRRGSACFNSWRFPAPAWAGRHR